MRTPKVAIHRFLIQFIGSENVKIGQKPGVARCEQTSQTLVVPEPTFVRVSLHKFTRSRRRDTILKVGFADSQHPSRGFRYSPKFVENARPKLRHEGTFVDSINEFRVHGSFAALDV
ncbi:MAG: hypothetical protein ACREDA_01730 [Methylocella sp.]